MQGFEESLERLGLGYLDLYLLHWPAPARDLYVETWEVLLGLQRDGRIHSAGVSNFEPEHLARLEVVPAVNQIELHPYLQQPRLREEHRERGIVNEAWSPLGQGAVLDDPVLNEIAARHGADAGQVALAWNLRLGNVVLTRTMTPERIRGNVEGGGARAQRRGHAGDRGAQPRRARRPRPVAVQRLNGRRPP